MQFTFGIVTDGNSPQKVKDLVQSICKNNIPKNDYEIIIIGGKEFIGENVSWFSFDESIKKSWITRKKNLITEHAKFENIVFLHDYLILDNDWYNGFLKFGDGWEICMNIITNSNGERFRDWVLCSNFIKGTKFDFGINLLLPYDISNLTQYQYISGTYWVAKRNIMQKYLLNENLSWGESEDIEWSERTIKKGIKYSMNIFSKVVINKEYKHPVFYLMNENQIKIAHEQ